VNLAPIGTTGANVRMMAFSRVQNIELYSKQGLAISPYIIELELEPPPAREPVRVCVGLTPRPLNNVNVMIRHYHLGAELGVGCSYEYGAHVLYDAVHVEYGITGKGDVHRSQKGVLYQNVTPFKRARGGSGAVLG